MTDTSAPNLPNGQKSTDGPPNPSVTTMQTLDRLAETAFVTFRSYLGGAGSDSLARQRWETLTFTSRQTWREVVLAIFAEYNRDKS